MLLLLPLLLTAVVGSHVVHAVTSGRLITKFIYQFVMNSHALIGRC